MLESLYWLPYVARQIYTALEVCSNNVDRLLSIDVIQYARHPPNPGTFEIATSMDIGLSVLENWVPGKPGHVKDPCQDNLGIECSLPPCQVLEACNPYLTAHVCFDATMFPLLDMVALKRIRMTSGVCSSAKVAISTPGAIWNHLSNGLIIRGLQDEYPYTFRARSLFHRSQVVLLLQSLWESILDR